MVPPATHGVRLGRPAKDPGLRHKGVHLSLPPWLVRALDDRSTRRNVGRSAAAAEVIAAGLNYLDHVERATEEAT
jgi:hypothetical protein